MEISNNIQTNFKTSNLPRITSRFSFKGYTHLPKDIFASSIPAKKGLIKSFIGAIGLGSIIKANEAKSPKHLEKLFQELYDFKGDNVDFAQLTFKRLKEHFGLTKVLAKELSISENIDKITVGHNIGAQFGWLNGSFNFNKETLQKRTKDQILASMRHELEHYLQYEKIVRAKNIGIDKLMGLFAKQQLKFMKEDYFEAGCADNLKFIKDEVFIDMVKKQINRNFWIDIVKKRGVIKSGTLEAMEAENNLNAVLNYPRNLNHSYVKSKIKNGLYDFTKCYKHEKYDYKYAINHMETEANIKGREIQEKYLDFEAHHTGHRRQIVEEYKEFSAQRYGAIKQFDKTLDERFGKYNLPKNFRAFIYDEVRARIGDENPDLDILPKLKLAPQKLSELDRKSVLNIIDIYSKLFKDGEINMRSQEEIEKVNKFIEGYKMENS